MRRTPWSVLVLALAASACAPAVAVPEPAPAAPAYDCPPAAERPGMIRLTDAAPTIREDIRYATANNFTGHALPGYEDPAALMRPDAAAARRSNHNKGNTVDLTVVRLDSGAELDMGTPFDHFGDESRTASASGQVAANRRILLDAMRAEGFTNYSQEWWHYTHDRDAEPVDVPIGCYL